MDSSVSTVYVQNLNEKVNQSGACSLLNCIVAYFKFCGRSQVGSVRGILAVRENSSSHFRKDIQTQRTSMGNF